ncbi:hypothetical protein [Paenibacillus xylanexedens]|uniref:hypothetical protein n=1 Tax=Paenibacillus xylanexedens TaxID=528191 RepID=UPI000F525C98|nr:hypothetical protein [Paenibacillus xylanexedens]RPK18627.1 Type I restriction-modification system, specificity subunit S [Paenibacillus xylanexedens]
MKKEIVNLFSLAKSDSLRLCYTKELPVTKHPLVKLMDCLESFESGSRPEGGIVYLEDKDCALSLGGEQIGIDGDVDLSRMPMVPLHFYENTDKGKVLTGDILLCKDGALTGKSCFVTDVFPVKEVMVNEHVYIFRGNGRLNQKILFHLIRSQFVQLQIKDLAYRKKGQPGLNTDHLTKIVLPDLNPNLQDELLKLIESLEYSIDQLKSTECSKYEVINKVFSTKFNLNTEEQLSIESGKKLNVNISNIGINNDNLRISFRWNKMQNIQRNLYKNIDCIDLLGNYIINTNNGWSPESIEGGEGIPVLGQEHFSFEGRLNIDPTKSTIETKKNIESFFIRQGDFFVSRGNTVDLVALASIVESEVMEDIIYPDLYIKVELNEKLINKKYLALVFNSFIGRLYFKYVSKGKNQTMVKISSSELSNFLLPIPQYDIQTEIVDSIEKQINALREIEKKIEDKKKELSQLIENVILN